MTGSHSGRIADVNRLQMPMASSFQAEGRYGHPARSLVCSVHWEHNFVVHA